MDMDARRWRTALSEAADCKDWIVESVAEGDTESKLISDIVEEVMFTCSSFPKAFETLPPFSKIPSNCWNYDAFLSFRGKDTGKTFTDHLNSALRHAGISTFLADDKLTRGENISTGLNNAIRGSSVSIVVFSKGYASSKWCLDEIAEIMQCMENRGHSFLPIFFNVSPSDVCNQTGAFAKAFARHKRSLRQKG
ncbi:TMV resistance protein N [Morella rubra]|uniref:ADP-ribosyl cyclase/cyclic ADP-ribose hydrolase n=1 Tax=Morella rubra TaxID=262757 RepID=A0A6A1WT33_9ROSI|nr:TMV resistance protein N [Morella rubra]